jgi:hypothetical protein
VVSTKCIDAWVLEFVDSNTTCKSMGENVLCWILIFVVLVNLKIHENKNPTNDNNFTLIPDSKSIHLCNITF